jgi:hypothetical protein
MLATGLRGVVIRRESLPRDASDRPLVPGSSNSKIKCGKL